MLTPLGLVAPRSVQMQKQHSQSAIDYRCPFLGEQNLCRIWTERPGECAGYWCDEKDALLSKSIKSYINFIEQSLAELWMIEAGYDFAEIQENWCRFDLFGMSEKSPTINLAKLWAHHRDQPKKYFARAADWFEGLSSSDIERLLGENGILGLNNSLTTLASQSKTQEHESFSR